MDTKYLFYTTLIISIIVQIITGVIEVGALFIKVPSVYSLIRELLMFELLQCLDVWIFNHLVWMNEIFVDKIKLARRN